MRACVSAGDKLSYTAVLEVGKAVEGVNGALLDDRRIQQQKIYSWSPRTLSPPEAPVYEKATGAGARVQFGVVNVNGAQVLPGGIPEGAGLRPLLDIRGRPVCQNREALL